MSLCKNVENNRHNITIIRYYRCFNRNGEISESICCLFNKCQNRKEAPKFCVDINTTYKITGRFLKLAFLSWKFRVNS